MYMSALTSARPTNETQFYHAAIAATLQAGELFVALSPSPASPTSPRSHATTHFPSSFSRSRSEGEGDDLEADADAQDIRGVMMLFPPGVDFLSDLNFGTDLGPMPYISGDEYSTFSCQYARTTR